MRSRTELVTTTFDLDSDEEDYSPDDDDSEEDWRPNKKQRQQKQTTRANGNNSSSSGAGAGGGGSDASSAGRKRKATATATAAKSKRRTIVPKVSDEDFESLDDEEDDKNLESEPSEGEFENVAAASTSTAKRAQSLPPKKQFVKLAQLDLLLNKRDLFDANWLLNSRLCLWRKDEQTNLLQKYLRVKTTEDAAKPQEQQLLFTSSSVVRDCTKIYLYKRSNNSKMHKYRCLKAIIVLFSLRSL